MNDEMNVPGRLTYFRCRKSQMACLILPMMHQIAIDIESQKLLFNNLNCNNRKGFFYTGRGLAA